MTKSVRASNNRLAVLVRDHLTRELEEWLGHDLPEPGTDDHDQWRCMEAEIVEIQTLEDALNALERIDDDPSEALRQLGIVPNDFKPSLGELHDLLGQGLPLPPMLRDEVDEEHADAAAYWASHVGKILSLRWSEKLRSIGIDPYMKPDTD